MDEHESGTGLESLEPLVGAWTIHARPPVGEPWPGSGRMTFEWLEGRAFLIQRWAVGAPGAPGGIAIIGRAGETGDFRQHYFDTRGVRRIYEMTFRDGRWTMFRDGPKPFPQRFSATLSADGTTISGRWDRFENGAWATDFHLTYRRAPA